MYISVHSVSELLLDFHAFSFSSYYQRWYTLSSIYHNRTQHMDFDFDISSDLLVPCDHSNNGQWQCPGIHKDLNGWVFSSIFNPPIRRASATSKQLKAKPKLAEVDESDSEEPLDDDTLLGGWTKTHSSIGKKVVAYFAINEVDDELLKAYVGEVTSFLPASDRHSADQLYKILYDDEDVADMDQKEFEEGRCAFEELYAEN